jgi:hypothetical protein
MRKDVERKFDNTISIKLYEDEKTIEVSDSR